MRLISQYQNTKSNKEDFAITPYLFLVYYWGGIKIIGIGFCWFHFSIYLGLGFNIPKEIKIPFKIGINKILWR